MVANRITEAGSHGGRSCVTSVREGGRGWDEIYLRDQAEAIKLQPLTPC